MMRKTKGSILIVTLFIIFLLSTIALSLSYSMRLKMNLLKRRIERFKSYHIAKGVLFLVFRELEKDKDGNDFDYLKESWFSKFSDNGRPRRLDFYGIEGEKEGSYKVFISDEESKININTASFDIFNKLLSNFKGINSRKIAEEIISYRKNKKELNQFYSIYELLMIKGVNKDIFFGKDRNDNVAPYSWENSGNSEPSLSDDNGRLILGLKDLVTIYTGGRININTAPFLVLSSMPGMSPQLAKSLIDERRSEPFRNIEGLKKILGVSEEAYTKISKWATVGSDCFRILTVARADNKISRQILVIVDRSKNHCKIKYWRQD